ncbi:hypothetical protein [Roseovarius arcticus]|uniref:hypothetical protein n=1 Tax=Roseovarius arcticus TaxID=2547404 RepID=UPI001110BDCB|nr:hypothetical protein [Roseovarius arcticus]
MNTVDSAKKCASTCWYVSVGIGLLLAIVLIAAAGWALLWSLLLSVIVFVALGFVLPQVICTAGTIERPMAAVSGSSSLVAGDAPPRPADDSYGAAAAAAAATPPPMVTPDEPAPQAHPIASEARKPKPDTKATDAQGLIAAATEKAKVKTAKTGSTGTIDAGTKPKTLSAPRDGAPDDLKMIKGVGPKLETMLHGMGFYHYDQIANWSDAEVAWVDENLQGFKGRATRDDWAGQASLLARGETTEFSSRASKGGIY